MFSKGKYGVQKGLAEDTHTTNCVYFFSTACSSDVRGQQQRGQAGSRGSASRQLPALASANGMFAFRVESLPCQDGCGY